MTLANKITLTRTFLGIILFFFIKHDNITLLGFSLLLLIISSVSDFIDGKIARDTNTITKFGAIVDPYADKIVVFSCYLAFLDIKELSIPVFAIFLIIIRELTVASLRVLAALDNYVLKAEPSGKFKTLLQFISIYLILIYLIIKNLSADNQSFIPIVKRFSFLPSYLIIITSVVTLVSGILYLANHYKMIEKQWGKQ
ncbi:MAG TPA: CDP-alcohol phosphatidyltransferase family protein [Elusimicrobiales bacterium]|jgi:CDP-diacylglycerol--glycerol-3-phosphate 3-phosphatidyltransferase|nr:CDP-alcohol phosphatidyltransferase family protein [Elusimicrobiales bacterium]HOL62886.1 CDP-alcohol phosphatidyltransferase family protein [Elusimicrobiales bacterium]HPO95000.1 CDP-alcohol phosphatidyltransferase family protein [Elusimicrobiales bacterium]